MANRFSLSVLIKGIDKFTRPISGMSRAVRTFSISATRNLRSVNRAIDSTVKGIKSFGKSATLIGGTAVAGIGLGLRSVMGDFMEFEDTVTGFVPSFGGSMKKAEAFTNKLVTFAEETPFALDTLSKGANILRSLGGFNAEESIRSMRILGDVSKGNAFEFERLVTNFSQIKALGKAQLVDVKQFAFAGVPMVEMLSLMLGKTKAQILDMAGKGKISFELIQKALEKMTERGGMFHQAMELFSKTLQGRLSTLNDKIKAVKVSFGKALAPTIKLLVEDFIKLTEKAKAWLDIAENQEMIKKKFVEFVEALKGIASWLRENGVTMIKWIGIIGVAIAVIKALVVVLLGVAAALAIISASPIVLIIAGIIAVLAIAGTAIFLFWDNIKTAVAETFSSFKNFFSFLSGIVDFMPMLNIFKPLIDGAIFLIDLVGKGLKEAFKNLLPKGLVDFFSDAKTVEVKTNADTVGDKTRIVSPQDRLSRSIEESRETSELVITGDTSNAKLVQKEKRGGGNTRIALMASGAF